MEIEHYPNLLVVTKLVRPIDISINYVRKIKSHLRPDLEEVFIHGVFVFSVSSIEVMLSDVLRYYLTHFPQKLSTDFKFDKDEFFKNHFTLLERAVDNYLYNLFYEPVEDYLNKFLKHLSIEWNGFQDSFGKDLQKIKTARNLLLHTGIAVRAGENGDDYDYVVQSIDKILNFEEELKKRISEKYKEYTKIKANKRLWKYMFKTPLMASYDDYWHYDESKDSIPGLKRSQYEDGLSSSETMLLELWRSHFNGAHIKNFNMKSLDGTNREKAMFFLSIASEFSFY